MEKKKQGSWVLKGLGVLFLLYVSLTIAINTGYYEAKLNEKMTITNEAIKKFEEDVREGKDVDISSYVTEIRRDYSNNTTKVGVTFSNVVQDFMSKGITELIEVFKKLFT